MAFPIFHNLMTALGPSVNKIYNLRKYTLKDTGCSAQKRIHPKSKRPSAKRPTLHCLCVFFKALEILSLYHSSSILAVRMGNQYYIRSCQLMLRKLLAHDFTFLISICSSGKEGKFKKRAMRGCATISVNLRNTGSKLSLLCSYFTR